MPHLRDLLGPLLAFPALLAAVPARATPPPEAADPTSAEPAPASSVPDEPFTDGERVRPLLSASFLSSVGLLPAVGFGVQAGIGARWHYYSVSLEGRILATPNFSITPDRMVQTGVAMAVVRTCGHPHVFRPPVDLIDLCSVTGIGAAWVVPVPSGNPNYQAESAHPVVAVQGLRSGVTWQVDASGPSVDYVTLFVEVNVGLGSVPLLYDGVPKAYIPFPINGIFGIQWGKVMSEPKKWMRPPKTRTRSIREE